MTKWYSLSENGYYDTSRQEIYRLTVECLLSMACLSDSDFERYKGDIVTADMVLDQINQSICWEGGDISIIEFIDYFIDDFESICKHQEIKALGPYMKSCIWNCLLTYKVKLRSHVPSA